MSNPVSRDRHVPELEAVRGIAILLVVIYHVMNLLLILRERAGDQPLASSLAIGPALETSALGGFLYAGHTGVSLFFVLSAYLLSGPFLNERRGGPTVAWGPFWRRRALRILPAYYVAVTVAVIATGPGLAHGLRGASYLLFANSLPGTVDPILPYSAVWWSLATEVQFYLLLPLAFGALRFRPARHALAVLLLANVAFYAWWARGPISESIEVELVMRHSLLGRASAFLFGILAAWLELRLAGVPGSLAGSPGAEPARRESAVLQIAWSLGILVCLACLGLLLSRVAAIGYYAAEIHFHYWHVAEAALWAAFIVLVQRARGPLHDLLCNRALQGLGVISYSLYLIHFNAIYFLGLFLDARGLLPVDVRSAAALPFFGLTMAASVLLSMLTYRVVEQPFLRRKRRRREQALADS